MDITEHDVIILGSGAAGLFLANELNRRQIRSLIIDRSPASAFSSTRNQGWLQSGAYYAARGDMNTAWACDEGFKRIAREFPEVMLRDTPAYMLFSDRDALEATVSRCTNEISGATIAIEEVSIEDVARTEPLARGSRHGYAAAISDRPFDTNKLLTQLATSASADGTSFEAVGDLRDVPIEDRDGYWQLDLESGTHRAPVMVAATGALLPRLYSSLSDGSAQELAVTKTVVMVVKNDLTPLAKSMLTTPRTDLGPNVVPFASARGTGVTVCLNQTDVAVDDRVEDDHDLPEGAITQFEMQLNAWYPGLARTVGELQPQGVHFYVCQKIKAQNRERLLLTSQSTSGAALFSFYSGKFTSAPASAYECAERIELSLRDWSPARNHRAIQEAIPIAVQKYYDGSTHRLVATSDTWATVTAGF